jgi:hypothetical protein
MVQENNKKAESAVDSRAAQLDALRSDITALNAQVAKQQPLANEMSVCSPQCSSKCCHNASPSYPNSAGVPYDCRHNEHINPPCTGRVLTSAHHTIGLLPTEQGEGHLRSGGS